MLESNETTYFDRFLEKNIVYRPFKCRCIWQSTDCMLTMFLHSSAKITCPAKHRVLPSELPNNFCMLPFVEFLSETATTIKADYVYIYSLSKSRRRCLILKLQGAAAVQQFQTLSLPHFTFGRKPKIFSLSTFSLAAFFSI